MLSLQIQAILKSGPYFPSKQQTTNLGKRKLIILCGADSFPGPHCTLIMAPSSAKQDRQDGYFPSIPPREAPGAAEGLQSEDPGAVSLFTVKQEEREELQTTVMEGFVKRKALSISSLTKNG